MRVEEVSKLCVELALDSIGRGFGEKCETVLNAQDMSDIEGLHPLLGEQKQHVQGRVTRSESELMICDEAVGEKQGFYVNNDGFHDLADDCK